MCVCVCVCVREIDTEWGGWGENCSSAHPHLQGRLSRLCDPMACVAIIRHGPIQLCRRHVATWQYSGREKSQLRVRYVNTLGFTELLCCVVRPRTEVRCDSLQRHGVLLEKPTGRSGSPDFSFSFPNGRYIDCLSLPCATNRSKTLKLQYRY